MKSELRPVLSAIAALACAASVLPAQVPGTPVAAPPANDPLNAVVKLEVAKLEPDFVTPWKTDQGAGSGSGVVVSEGRILTCAHCVADSTHIRIRKQNEDSFYQGEVEFIDNDCDLALVRVDDPAFMADISPMRLGKTPALQDTVVAVGYPVGGMGISFTRGIVSRIEDIRYSHSWYTLLGIQVDAAINHGNSGGPVLDISTLDIVGIAFQGDKEGEALGYMIPPDIIRHFLDDIGDSRVDGFAMSVFSVQSLESESARRYLGMDGNQTGVLVTDVAKCVSDDFVRVGDVILEIGGYKVANNGVIRVEGNARRSYLYPVYMRQIGEKVPARVLRSGEVVETFIPVMKRNSRARGFIHDKQPDYYVFGGYVFTTVSMNFLLLKPSFHDNVLEEKAFPEDEAVAISDVLADSATEGYLGSYGAIVRTVNGVKVRNLRHLIELFEKNEDEFLRVMLDDNTEYDVPLYLDAKQLREATPRILKRYLIPSDRSDDLK